MHNDDDVFRSMFLGTKCEYNRLGRVCFKINLTLMFMKSGAAARPALCVAAFRGNRWPRRLRPQHALRRRPLLALARRHPRTKEVQLGSYRALLIQSQQEEPDCGMYIQFNYSLHCVPSWNGRFQQTVSILFNIETNDR